MFALKQLQALHQLQAWHVIGHNEGYCILLPCFYGIRLWVGLGTRIKLHINTRYFTITCETYDHPIIESHIRQKNPIFTGLVFMNDMNSQLYESLDCDQSRFLYTLSFDINVR